MGQTPIKWPRKQMEPISIAINRKRIGVTEPMGGKEAFNYKFGRKGPLHIRWF